jgi:hypothetical protein
MRFYISFHKKKNMAPIMHLPPGLTVNNLRRLNALLNTNFVNYNALLKNIARRSGLHWMNVNNYVNRYKKLVTANNRRRGITRNQRVQAKVRQAVRAFKNTRRTHAMIGQLRETPIPPDVRRQIARTMRRLSMMSTS